MNQVQQLLAEKKYKDFGINETIARDWTCSTGSLELDMYLGGGFRPGVFRISGPFESGKTCFSLTCGKYFQETVENPFVVYINAEGRITKEKLAISGISTANDVYQQIDFNVADVVYDLIRDLITDNPKKLQYMFILDSLDALERLGDISKQFSESNQVAGGALINSVFGKRTTLPLTINGHAMFILSQERVEIPVGHSHRGPQIKPSGGKAVGHYSSVTAEIAPKFIKDYIWEKEKAAEGSGDRGKVLGHYVTFKFAKTRNDKTLEKVVIPIKRGRIGGKSIWIERELFSLASQFQLLRGKGWMDFAPQLIAEMKSAGIELIQKIQGEKAVIEYFEQHPEVTEFLISKFRKLIHDLSPFNQPQNPEAPKTAPLIERKVVEASTGIIPVVKRRGRPPKAK